MTSVLPTIPAPATERAAPAVSTRPRPAARENKTRLAAVICACLVGLGLVAAPDRADAGADGVLMFDGVFVASTDAGRLSDSRGAGVTMRVLGTREPFNLQIGAFAALGQPDGDKLMRDIYDVHVSLGLNPPTKKRRIIVPFASLGVDFIYVNTRAPNGNQAAGMTMGLDLRGGVFGHLTRDWIYTASAAYIGAVVPGTGEGLDGLVFQVGIGKRLFD